MQYLILYIKACMVSIDAYLLEQQGRMDLVGEALNLRYEYERQMSHIRLNKKYGSLR